MNDELYTVKEVAKKLNYSESSIRHFIRINLLKAKKCSSGTRKFLISERDFEDFVSRFV